MDADRYNANFKVSSSNTSRNSKVEPNDVGPIDILTQVLTYLQIKELDVGFTPKEKDWVFQKGQNISLGRTTPSQNMVR
jgi:hypothetical protein